MREIRTSGSQEGAPKPIDAPYPYSILLAAPIPTLARVRGEWGRAVVGTSLATAAGGDTKRSRTAVVANRYGILAASRRLSMRAVRIRNAFASTGSCARRRISSRYR